MKKILVTSVLLLLFGFLSCQNQEKDKKSEEMTNTHKTKPMESSYSKTDAEWKKILTPEQYEVLREKGTERPGTGEYNHHSQKGVYTCAGCGTELFTSE